MHIRRFALTGQCSPRPMSGISERVGYVGVRPCHRFDVNPILQRDCVSLQLKFIIFHSSGCGLSRCQEVGIRAHRPLPPLPARGGGGGQDGDDAHLRPRMFQLAFHFSRPRVDRTRRFLNEATSFSSSLANRTITPFHLTLVLGAVHKLRNAHAGRGLGVCF